MDLKIGDLVTIADRYVPTAKLANRRIQTGIVVEIIKAYPRDTLGSNATDVIVLWPNGELTSVNAWFIKKRNKDE
ncbi:MAG: hypothetical protein CBB97_00405 [Candidatus Endolissoclinum sp. TMED37]|nr:MAG: hypothetical protein CBB97_00405 [Candidatus Endolissoclinum sp. TMED37]